MNAKEMFISMIPENFKHLVSVSQKISPKQVDLLSMIDQNSIDEEIIELILSLNDEKIIFLFLKNDFTKSKMRIALDLPITTRKLLLLRHLQIIENDTATLETPI